MGTVRCQLAVEDMEPGHWIAWVLDLPGCYGSGRTADGAVAAAPPAAGRWWGRLGRPVDGPVEVAVVERFDSYLSEPDYRVNAFFADDARPLSRREVDLGLEMLELTRRDLLAALPERLSEEVVAILGHVARAEWWYLTRLGLASGREEAPSEPAARVAWVRAMTRAALPRLAGDDRAAELRGERWSGRKLLRRALWHEQDHARQIGRLAQDALIERS